MNCQTEAGKWWDALKTVRFQAGLKNIKWGKLLMLSSEAMAEREFARAMGSVTGELSKLEAWAGRTLPSGIYLLAARSFYRQYTKCARDLERRYENVTGKEVADSDFYQEKKNG